MDKSAAPHGPVGRTGRQHLAEVGGRRGRIVDILGMEGGGTVAAVGPGVGKVRPGDPVAYCLSRGSYAQYAMVPAWRLVKVPGAVPLEIATALAYPALLLLLLVFPY